MADISTIYTPGGTETATQGRAVPGMGGDLAPLLALLARRMAEKKQAAAAPAGGGVRRGSSEVLGRLAAPAPTGGGGGGRGMALGSPEAANPIDLQLDFARKAGEIERLNAMSRPAPMKMTYGFNREAGYTLDPAAMNAYQRQMFLPQSADGEESIGDRERKGFERASAERDREYARREEGRKADQADADWLTQEARRRGTSRRLGFTTEA